MQLKRDQFRSFIRISLWICTNYCFRCVCFVKTSIELHKTRISHSKRPLWNVWNGFFQSSNWIRSITVQRYMILWIKNNWHLKWVKVQLLICMCSLNIWKWPISNSFCLFPFSISSTTILYLLHILWVTNSVPFLVYI